MKAFIKGKKYTHKEYMELYQLDDLSCQAQKYLIDKVGLSFKLGSDSFKSYLNKMGLISIDEKSKTACPTSLGLLLLGHSPEKHFPQAHMKFTVRRTGLVPIIKEIKGALVLLPEKIEEYLEFIFPKGISSRTSFNRNEVIDPSFCAYYEVIMNAIVHRDYSIESDCIIIEIDDEKVVVSSPGKPVCTLKQLNDLTAPPLSRNAKISNLFLEMGFVYERGSGMIELSKLENLGLLKPMFALENNSLKTILFRESNPKR